MSEDELLAVWRRSDWPFHVQKSEDGLKVSWGDDSLDYIILTPRHVRQLIERLQNPNL